MCLRRKLEVLSQKWHRQFRISELVECSSYPVSILFVIGKRYPSIAALRSLGVHFALTTRFCATRKAGGHPVRNWELLLLPASYCGHNLNVPSCLWNLGRLCSQKGHWTVTLKVRSFQKGQKWKWASKSELASSFEDQSNFFSSLFWSSSWRIGKSHKHGSSNWVLSDFVVHNYLKKARHQTLLQNVFFQYRWQDSSSFELLVSWS